MLKTSREREREKAPSKRPDDPSRYDSYRKKEEEGGEEEGKKEDRVYNKNIKTRPGFLLSSYFFHSPFLGTKRILGRKREVLDEYSSETCINHRFFFVEGEGYREHFRSARGKATETRGLVRQSKYIAVM